MRAEFIGLSVLFSFCGRVYFSYYCSLVPFACMPLYFGGYGVHRSKTSANYCEEEACLFFSMAFFLLYWCIIKELAGCEFSSLSGFL